MGNEIQEGGEVGEQRQQTALSTHCRLWAIELPVSFLHAWLFMLACVLSCSSLIPKEHNLCDHFYLIKRSSHNV